MKLKGLIHFWEAKLASDRTFMDLSTQALIEMTIKGLKAFAEKVGLDYEMR